MAFHHLSHNFTLETATCNFFPSPNREPTVVGSHPPSLLRCFSSVKASTPQMWKASSILWIPWGSRKYTVHISAPKKGHFPIFGQECFITIIIIIIIIIITSSSSSSSSSTRWLNQPIWKILLSQNWVHLPQIGVKMLTKICETTT